MIKYNTNTGLKSFVYAKRKVSSEFVEKVIKNYEYLVSSFHEKESKHAQLCELLETELEFQGVFGLRNCCKPDTIATIHSLKELGTNIHMLTGDKMVNAIIVAHSLKLFNNPSIDKYHHLDFTNEADGHNQLKEILDRIKGTVVSSDLLGQPPKIDFKIAINKASGKEDSNQTKKKVDQHAQEKAKKEIKFLNILISGSAVNFISKSPYFSEHLRFVFEFTRSVVGYEMSPTEKAQIVRFFKQNDRVTLAVGDGYNDINMLQAANIGFQVMCEEVDIKFGDIIVNNLLCIPLCLNMHCRDWNNNMHVSVNNLLRLSIVLGSVQLLSQIYAEFSGITFFTSFFVTSTLFFATVIALIFSFVNKHFERKTRAALTGMYCEKDYVSSRRTINTLIFDLFPESFVTAAMIVFTTVHTLQSEITTKGVLMTKNVLVVVVHMLCFFSFVVNMVLMSFRQKIQIALLSLLVIIVYGSSVVFCIHIKLFDFAYSPALFELFTTPNAILVVIIISLAILMLQSIWWLSVLEKFYYPITHMINQLILKERAKKSEKSSKNSDTGPSSTRKDASNDEKESESTKLFSEDELRKFARKFKKFEPFTTIYKRCFSGKYNVNTTVTDMLLPEDEEINTERLDFFLHFNSKLLSKKFRVYISSRYTKMMLFIMFIGGAFLLSYLIVLYILDPRRSPELLLVYILIAILLPVAYYASYGTRWSRRIHTYSTLYFSMLLISSIIFVLTTRNEYIELGVVIIIFTSLNLNLFITFFMLFCLISLGGYALA